MFKNKRKLFKLKKDKINRPLFIRKKRIDFIMLALVLALSLYGLVVISSATLSYGGAGYVKRQAIASILGLVLMGGLMVTDYRLWKKLYLLIYGVSIFLLILTLVFGYGSESWGADSWLRIGGINFQPAEFVKVALVISLATWLDDHYSQLNEPKTLIKTLVFAGLPVLLILLQPDFGTAMVFIFFIAVMLFFAQLDWKYILGALALGLASLPLIYLSLSPYQKDRIHNFFDASQDTSGSSYQIVEGRIAIGSGQLLGRGLYQGTQTQYNYIPTKATDFIFAVLVEELGFVGGALLILLYAGLFARMFKTAHLSRDRMGSLMVIGFMAIFLIHIWENIGMTIGLMPITGIPLPFISYGGSFQLVNLICIGLILSVRFNLQAREVDQTHPLGGLHQWIRQKEDQVTGYFDRKLKEEREKRK
ncbi:MAG: rod shape-determining protein RodA [Tissierellia bacterium]|nr:rod shape-determining protein RodA [Tissierellia bacterium]